MADMAKKVSSSSSLDSTSAADLAQFRSVFEAKIEEVRSCVLNQLQRFEQSGGFQVEAKLSNSPKNLSKAKSPDTVSESEADANKGVAQAKVKAQPKKKKIKANLELAPTPPVVPISDQCGEAGEKEPFVKTHEKLVSIYEATPEEVNAALMPKRLSPRANNYEQTYQKAFCNLRSSANERQHGRKQSQWATTAQLDPIVVASCPEEFHDEVAKLCDENNMAKAFGRKGDMVDTLAGKDWMGKWEAKVVLSAVTKAKSMGREFVTIVCIQGGPHCDKELAAQPRLMAAIKQEYGDPHFKVKVDWIEMVDFRFRFVEDLIDQQAKLFISYMPLDIRHVVTMKTLIEEKMPLAEVWLDSEQEWSKSVAVERVRECTHFILFLTKDAAGHARVSTLTQQAIAHKLKIMVVDPVDDNFELGHARLNQDERVFSEMLCGQDVLCVPWSMESAIQEVGLDKIIVEVYGEVFFDSPFETQIQWDQIPADQRLMLEAVHLPLFARTFEIMCAMSGLRLPGCPLKIWCPIIRVCMMLCGLAHASRLFFPDAPANADIRTTLVTSLFFFLTAYVAWNVGRFTQTPKLRKLLALHAHDMNIANAIRATSSKAATVGGITFFAIGVINIVFGAQSYLDSIEGSTAQKVIFTSCAALSLLCTLPAYMVVASAATIVHLLLWILEMDFATAFEQMHPQIMQLGISKCADKRVLIHMKESDFVRFQRMYVESYQRAMWCMTQLSSSVVMLYIIWFINFGLQVLLSAKIMKEGKTKADEGTIVWAMGRVSLVVLFDLLCLGPFSYTAWLEGTMREWISQLVFTKQDSRVAMSVFIDEIKIEFPLLGAITGNATVRSIIFLVVSFHIALVVLTELLCVEISF